ncbi:MAG TPA: preprotein translocase subunit SecG [Longimicrobiaceae bacterium]|nr:preprotein translocase subunit SecG [Longimicrobiaceae bacterium]
MFYFLLTLLILDAILLTTVVLLQSGKGGGLAAMGGGGGGASDSLFGSRQATTLLTKASWWLGGAFLVLAYIISLIAGPSATPESILSEGLAVPSATSPVVPEILDAPAETPASSGTAPAPAGEPDPASSGQ